MITSAQAMKLLRQQQAKTGRKVAIEPPRPLCPLDAPGPVEFVIPVRTWNGMNRKCHWAVASRRANAAKAATLEALMGRSLPPKPVSVRMVRIGKRRNDDDGVSASLKHVRDTIAKAYGVDDGDVEQIRFEVGQEIGKEYGVRVRFETRQTTAPCGG